MEFFESEAARPEGIVTIKKFDAYTGEQLDEYVVKNRLVMRYTLVLTHLLAQAPSNNNLSGSLFNQLVVPSASDLRITKMRLGTNGNNTDITMSGLVSPISPGNNPDGSVTTNNYIPIDTYQYSNGTAVNSVPFYDQSISFIATLAGPQYNATVGDNIIREAGIFTQNDIMFARVQLPNLTKNSSIAYSISHRVRFV